MALLTVPAVTRHARPARVPTRTTPPHPFHPPARAPTALAAVPGADPLLPLGLDFLTFLATTTLVVPVFKSARVSPVLGFLFSGLVLDQLGLFRDTAELEKLSQLGVLFLLFEMGLELSFDRLRALAKYAFGLGTLTMAVTTLIFACMGLPVGEGLGTEILVQGFHADRSLVSIRSLDEAVVIGAALSLSSSAFVLQLLSESGGLTTRAGSATLGILLLQDIAVVPFLVLLPVVEGNDLTGPDAASLLASLAPTAAKTVIGLGALLLGGRFFVRRVFEVVAASRSDETFVALCLLSVTGASLATQRLGFSDTLGAFSAGVLLAETNYRAQVEADIRPFRGILLGLFFVTTGASLDVQLLLRDWQLVVALLAGLVAIKVGTIGTFAPLFGLTRAEAARTAFSLAQGGEFAFVLLQLAKELEILPDELNRLLLIVVVLSMALTPGLVALGDRVATSYEAAAAAASPATSSLDDDSYEGAPSPVVVCGFGELGQMVANALESPLAGGGGARGPPPYIAFDLNPGRVRAARDAGFNVLYGDGSRSQVLEAAGVGEPSAIVVCYTARARAVTATRALREALPGVPVYARALDTLHAAELKAAGATDVVTANVEAGLELTARVLSSLGAGSAGSLAFLQGLLRSQMDVRATALAAALPTSAEGGGAAYDSTIFRIDTAAQQTVVALPPPAPLPPPLTDTPAIQPALPDGRPDGSLECPVWSDDEA